MQNIYSRIYNVQNIPPNKKSLPIPQKSKITICNNIMCLEVAFYRINTKQHLNPYSIQSSRCYITNYCIYDKTTISILKSALHKSSGRFRIFHSPYKSANSTYPSPFLWNKKVCDDWELFIEFGNIL